MMLRTRMIVLFTLVFCAATALVHARLDDDSLKARILREYPPALAAP